MERAYKITEVCGDWALHIPPYGKTDAEMILIFNSRNNAELVKSVLEWEDAHPNAAVPYKSTLAPPNEAPPCYQPDGDGCAYQCYDGDDEPIDKCKEFPLCYSDKQRHHAPPNEWVSVKTPPTTQGWYHVAVLDLKTGKYTVEQDLYSIELAKAYGFEPGFCKATRWEERERIDYWCRFPAPPDRRPPEGETNA